MYHAIVFFPLIGALIAGLFGRVIGPRVAEYVTTSCLGFACLIAWGAFFLVTGEGHAERVQVASTGPSGSTR